MSYVRGTKNLFMSKPLLTGISGNPLAPLNLLLGNVYSIGSFMTKKIEEVGVSRLPVYLRVSFLALGQRLLYIAFAAVRNEPI